MAARPPVEVGLKCTICPQHKRQCLSLALQVGLGKFEGGELAQSFMRMGDKAELLSKSAREQSASLSTSFEAPLKVRILSAHN